MHQPNRKAVETVRDGVAARVVNSRLDEAPTLEMPAPRRKRYTLQFDLDAEPPAEAEPCAPRAALDL